MIKDRGQATTGVKAASLSLEPLFRHPQHIPYLKVCAYVYTKVWSGPIFLSRICRLQLSYS